MLKDFEGKENEAKKRQKRMCHLRCEGKAGGGILSTSYIYLQKEGFINCLSIEVFYKKRKTQIF